MLATVYNPRHLQSLASRITLLDPNGAKENEFEFDNIVTIRIGEKYLPFYTSPSSSEIMTTVLQHLKKNDWDHAIQPFEFEDSTTATPLAASIHYNLLLLKLLKKLDDFSSLELNWDSYGADPISQIVISNIRRLLPKIFDHFERQRVFSFNRFSVVPSCEGGVQLEIRINNREIEIENTPDCEYYGVLLIEKKNGEYLYEEKDVKENQIFEKLSWLI